MATSNRVDCFLKILGDLGVPLCSEMRVLDLGCGSGRLVEQGRSRGYDFYGCDFILWDDHRECDPELLRQSVLRPIDRDGYRLPFEDAFFDIVISDQVMEHVMDYPTTLSEIQRILRPGGAFLHMFPSRYKLIEPHILVPLATTIRSPVWLKFWALLGIRNQFQRQLSISETCAANLTFLTEHTNYLPKRRLRELFGRYFTDVEFVERLFLKCSKRGRKVLQLSLALPFLPHIYSALGSRVAFGRRERI